jgi:hypothetical protein
MALRKLEILMTGKLIDDNGGDDDDDNSVQFISYLFMCKLSPEAVIKIIIIIITIIII